MTETQTYIFHAKAFKCYVVNAKPWFRAKDVAAFLEYNDTKKLQQTMLIVMTKKDFEY